MVFGKLILALYLGIFTVDLLLRPFPVDYLAFRAWESMSRYRSAYGPASPGRSFHSDHSYGDLANLANMRSDRIYRQEILTTDIYGYRNPHWDPALQYQVAVLGSSFAAGFGVKDEETLSEQISAQSGGKLNAYSGAGYAMNSIRLKRLIERIKLQGGWVVFEQLERLDFPSEKSDIGMGSQMDDFFESPMMRKMAINLKDYFALSPLAMLSRKWVNVLKDGYFFPNPYAARVEKMHLHDGRSILFLPQELQEYSQASEQKTAQGVRYFTWLKNELAKYNIRLLVLLVPNKYTVYAERLEPAPETKHGAYFSQLSEALNRAGILNLDLTENFQNEAKRENLYFFDDTHWNAHGIRIAAKRAVDAILSYKK